MLDHRRVGPLLAIPVATGAGWVLRAAAPPLPPISDRSAVVHWLTNTAPTDILVTVAAGCAWLCLAWLAFGLVLVLLCALPGAFGSSAAVLADRLTPVLLRRAVEAALGAALAAVPVSVAALPAAAAPAARSGAGSGHEPSGWPDLDRPVVTAPARAHPASTPRNGPLAAQSVIVRPGDTLWQIARRALPPGATAADIAAEWPRWYAANRAAIGGDPDLIRPGQRLHAPN